MAEETAKINGTPPAPPPDPNAWPQTLTPAGMPPIRSLYIPSPQLGQAIRAELIQAMQADPAFKQHVSVLRTNFMKAKTETSFKFAIVLLDPMTPAERAEVEKVRQEVPLVTDA